MKPVEYLRLHRLTRRSVCKARLSRRHRYRGSVRPEETTLDVTTSATWPIRFFAGYHRSNARSADLTGSNGLAWFAAESERGAAVAGRAAIPWPARSRTQLEVGSCWRAPTWKAPGQPPFAPRARLRFPPGLPPWVSL